MSIPTKLNRKQRELLKAWQEQGWEIDQELEDELISLGTIPQSQAPRIAREAEAVILQIEKPGTIRQKLCKECGLAFQTTSMHEAMCSNDCRIVWLGKRGILWHPDRPEEERWSQSEIPYTVEPRLFEQLKIWATWILDGKVLPREESRISEVLQHQPEHDNPLQELLARLRSQGSP